MSLILFFRALLIYFLPTVLFSCPVRWKSALHIDDQFWNKCIAPDSKGPVILSEEILLIPGMNIFKVSAFKSEFSKDS